MTDNARRTGANVRDVIKTNGSVLLATTHRQGPGCRRIVVGRSTDALRRCRVSPVSFLFERKGLIRVERSQTTSFDSLFELVLDAGADDVIEFDGEEGPEWEVRRRYSMLDPFPPGPARVSGTGRGEKHF